jgi:hypothetical protein
LVLGVPVRAKVENQSGNKHVESLKIRRLDEGSNPSDSTDEKGGENFEWVFKILTSQMKWDEKRCTEHVEVFIPSLSRGVPSSPPVKPSF